MADPVIVTNFLYRNNGFDFEFTIRVLDTDRGISMFC
ncbi:hypothetical protein QE439_000673 [Pedobacter agri]|nr:hypothetical protein [Pedobacter agri]